MSKRFAKNYADQISEDEYLAQKNDYTKQQMAALAAAIRQDKSLVKQTVHYQKTLFPFIQSGAAIRMFLSLAIVVILLFLTVLGDTTPSRDNEVFIKENLPLVLCGREDVTKVTSITRTIWWYLHSQWTPFVCWMVWFVFWIVTMTLEEMEIKQKITRELQIIKEVLSGFLPLAFFVSLAITTVTGLTWNFANSSQCVAFFNAPSNQIYYGLLYESALGVYQSTLKFGHLFSIPSDVSLLIGTGAVMYLFYTILREILSKTKTHLNMFIFSLYLVVMGVANYYAAFFDRHSPIRPGEWVILTVAIGNTFRKAMHYGNLSSKNLPALHPVDPISMESDSEMEEEIVPL